MIVKEKQQSYEIGTENKGIQFSWPRNPKRINGKTRSIEKGYRSVVKTISWRAVGTIDTIIISWIIVGDFRFAVSIGGVELFTKMFLYYFHERLWARSNFGRVREPAIEYEI